MRHGSLAPAVAFVAVVACGPEHGKEPTGDEAERYAEHVCGAVQDCGCFDYFGSQAACETDMRARFESFLDDDFELDAECFESTIELVGDCTAVNRTPPEWRCIVLRGDKPSGSACQDHTLSLAPFGVDECASDLSCRSGTCVPGSPPVLIEGAPCSAGPDTCGDFNLYCGPTGHCDAKALEGEPCDSPWGCALGAQADGTALYCAGLDQGICTRQSLVGAACNPQDWNPCSEGPDPDTNNAWCDPSENVCVAEGPGICHVTDFPSARP